jgi:hypothetical protein
VTQKPSSFSLNPVQFGAAIEELEDEGNFCLSKFLEQFVMFNILINITIKANVKFFDMFACKIIILICLT